MRWLCIISSLALSILILSQGCDIVEPDGNKFKSIPHTLEGIDANTYNGKARWRDISIPAEGMSFTFLPAKEYIDRIYVQFITLENPDSTSEYPTLGVYSHSDHHPPFEAERILASDTEWYHIAYGPDTSVHDVEIEIKPNNTGQERVIMIEMVCEGDACRTMGLKIIQEPLQL